MFNYVKLNQTRTGDETNHWKQIGIRRNDNYSEASQGDQLNSRVTFISALMRTTWKRTTSGSLNVRQHTASARYATHASVIVQHARLCTSSRCLHTKTRMMFTRRLQRLRAVRIRDRRINRPLKYRAILTRRDRKKKNETRKIRTEWFIINLQIINLFLYSATTRVSLSLKTFVFVHTYSKILYALSQPTMAKTNSFKLGFFLLRSE